RSEAMSAPSGAVGRGAGRLLRRNLKPRRLGSPAALRPEIGPPLLCRRDAIAFAVAFGEMRRGGEAAGNRNVENGAVGAPQQVARGLEPELEVVLPRRAVEVAPKQALELPRAEVDRHRQLLARQRILDMQVHDADRVQNLGVGDPGPSLEI